MVKSLETYWQRLRQGFTAIYAALTVPRIARRTVFVLLVIHTILLAYTAYVHSPTLNEPGHLVAGLSNWRFGRFEVFRVNPPLVRMVAALPVMAVGYKEDWSGFYEGPGSRPVFGMGEDFVAANGERSFFLFVIARWACIPFSWIGAIVCYLWARDLYGRPSGVLAAAIWCFEPNILAHASLITCDVGATALSLASCYMFWRWLKQPTWTRAALTGVVLGLAELTKTTLILFFPMWPLMWLVYRGLTPSSPSKMISQAEELTGGKPMGKRCLTPSAFWFREARMLALVLAIGLHVLNLGYGFEGSLTQLKEFQFVSDLFAGVGPGARSQESGNPHSSTSVSQLAPSASPINRFTNSWLGEVPVPFPENYLLGIDIQQKDFEHYRKPSYLRGQWQDHGWWYYYLYACAIKVPLGLWALGVFTLIARLLPRPLGEGRGEGKLSLSLRERLGEGQLTPNDQRPTPPVRDEFILLFPAFVVFAVVSSKTGFSEHMRYVLLSFPHFFIAVSQIVQPRSLTNDIGSRYKGPSCARGQSGSAKVGMMALFSTALLSVLGCWIVSSSLWIYPHSLSYFNESIGGPLNGPKHLLGSNVEWGQDLRYLKSWFDQRPSHLLVCLAYHGSTNPTDFGLGATVPCQDLVHQRLEAISRTRLSSVTNDSEPSIVYVISLNLLHGFPRQARDGVSSPKYDLRRSTALAIQRKQVSHHIGYTINVYEFSYAQQIELLDESTGARTE